MDGRTTNGRMDGHADEKTDGHRETIIPRRCCVEEYKNQNAVCCSCDRYFKGSNQA